MDLSEVAERISRKFSSMNVEIDPALAEKKLRTLVEEFGVNIPEAEKTVTENLAKEHNLSLSPSSSPRTTTEREIGGLVTGEWVTIEGLVVSLTVPPTDAIAQSGVIADASGAIQFTMWSRAGHEPLVAGQWYRFESAVVDEYRGVPKVNLHQGTTITPIEGKKSFTPKYTGVADLKPGIASVRVKMLQEWENRHERILQTGLVGDGSGRIKFTIWKEEGKKPLAPDTVYAIHYATVEEYQGRLSITLNTADYSVAEGGIEVVSGPSTPMKKETVTGKVVTLTTATSPSIAQTGIIAYPEGAMTFVAWERSGAPAMEYGKWYRLENASIDQFRGAPRVNIGEGTSVIEIESDTPIVPAVIPVCDLAPGVASVRVKMVQEWEARHERILQTGLVGDESGTVKFTIWKEEGVEPLSPNMVYTIYYTTVDEYQGRLSITLNGAMVLAEEGATLEVGTGGMTLTGAIVNIGPGSGLIKRCPVEGCNRVLSKRNYCPVHEVQNDFRYDLRIKAVLDDGVKAHNILMQKEVVEAVAGLTLEDAVKTVQESPLGMDDIFYRLRDALMGRYYACRGGDLGDTLLVKECTPLGFDGEQHAALLNRLGGEINAS
ncbi:nucleic acid binding OB-fold tRNA/helicase-type [Methanofollis liminatans DSM 4140]|uniref:Nucleic acid binding OB-fold tRNA/helicase-type n=1 Tax=Methanofollis liminatans DSM 4140 TaxID=28892 RepID=J1L589_9EURY|nr:hypothetical protein [Methanofollis liminatans]EJG08297.1 nucleic acid binding OB-fold tRNA/helicase-type [Methanofollis liminatans DSM 4140]